MQTVNQMVYTSVSKH